MQEGFMKVAAAVPAVKVADCRYNVSEMESIIAQAEGRGVEIIVFPELSLTGYTCQDLFHQKLLLDAAEAGVLHLLDFTRKLDVICIVGAPVPVDGALVNAALVIQQGQLLGIVPKTYLPNYAEFYEKRWFVSSRDLRPSVVRYAGQSLHIGPDPQLFVTADGLKFGIEICEDVWAPTPPSNRLALEGAEVIFNLSASDELIGKHRYLCSLLEQQSARTLSAYVYAGCGFGESTQDVVYGGNAFVFENGALLAATERFQLKSQWVTAQVDVERLRAERRNNTTFAGAVASMQRLVGQKTAQSVPVACQPIALKDFVLERPVDAHPFIPKAEDMAGSCEEIFSIQVMGLAKRLVHTGCKRVVIGISGGLDSTLALLVCVKTFDKLSMDRRGIIGVTMPGFGTTDRTYHNALTLMQHLGITMKEISIAKSVTQHFEDIGHDASVHDVAYENCQARERTQILMDLSNEMGGLVIGTGDLSELALGWATYNGDHMSMYGVNASIPKTLIRHLVSYVSGTIGDSVTRQTLHDIIDTPISPELIPADENGDIKQKTEDLVGPYELHDFFLYYILRFGFRPSRIFLLARKAFSMEQYSDEVIRKWLHTFCRRFFAQQFKRSCLPDGPKVGSVSLSPRGDWRMPTDAVSSLWTADSDEA